jgi:hypothetical protein
MHIQKAQKIESPFSFNAFDEKNPFRLDDRLFFKIPEPGNLKK